MQAATTAGRLFRGNDLQCAYIKDFALGGNIFNVRRACTTGISFRSSLSTKTYRNAT